MSRIVKDYLHVSKESVYEDGEELGLTEQQILNWITALYEVEFLVDVDKGQIVGVNGKLLSSTEGEFTSRGE